ncbi:MAG: acyl-CoA thioester hydrolase, YbgC/YbaW family [Clostridiales bacterium]|jgi:acyl-CoA thioester hydrolase|nr:acyl-CoA thioester hydrolase, YbgC/YbaW family [Clostridiales bacterium]
MPARTEIRVRYAETDKMGVVYHSNYFVWMEIGRTELFRKMGLPYKVIEEKGIIFPVVEAFCRYKKSALYDDEIVIETVLKHYSAAKVVLDYKIIRKKDEVLLAEGETVHGIVTTEGKPVSIKKLPWLQEKFDKIMEIRGN